MTDSSNIKLPTSLRDITVGQYQRYVKIYNKNKDELGTSDFLSKKLIEVFCNIPLQEVDELELGLFQGLITHLNNLLNEKQPLVRTFDLIGTDNVVAHFGMIPNLDKMSYGEFIDLEKYMFDDENFHRALAVMYRPIESQHKDKYLIHPYKGTEYLAEVMKDTPLDVALGVRVFFYRLATKLGNYTMVSTLKELQQKQEGLEDEHSLKSGETINQYLLSLEKMLEESEKLQNSPYINA